MIRVRDLPHRWYDRDLYHPRVREDGADRWFVLTHGFAPAEEPPLEPPREPRGGRAALAGAFAETYERWRLPAAPAARRSLDLLGRAGTAAIVTGQQPGFLGGPLHTLYKALAVIAAARLRETLTGSPCVPVFWVAGDDHDLDEVREARFPGPSGTEASFRLPHEADRRPLSSHPVDAAALDVLDAASTHFSVRKNGDRARALIDLYRGRNLASGFAALLADLLGPEGLVLLDPETVRPMASRVFRRVIEEPEQALARIEEGRREVESLGIKPLVAARLPLFLVREGRRDHLSPAPGGLQVDGGGPVIPRADLLRALDTDPRAFSTGALLRPIVQEECLPCVLSVGGPAEVGYFRQIGPLAAQLGYARPRIALRLNASIADGKSARTAEAAGPDRIAAARSSEDLLLPAEEPAPIALARASSERAAADLLAAARAVAAARDGTRLERRADELAGELAALVDRIRKASLASRDRELDEAKRLWRTLFPEGALQERRWGWLHFVAKHGDGWIPGILDGIREAPLRVVHRLLTFEEEES